MSPGILILLFFGLLLPACAPMAEQPLPTLRPVAMVPAQRQTVPLPATFTPVPAAPRLPTETPAAGAPTSTTGSLAPTPAPLPTRSVPPAVAVRQAAPGQVRFLSEPPDQIDCTGAGLLFQSRFPSGVGGPWRDYHAYLPPCYGHDGRVYPVLYLFHGSIQTDSHWADLGLEQQMNGGINRGSLPPFIAIMPFNGEIGNMTSGNDHSVEGITIHYLLPYIDATYCTWPTAGGRGVGGISRGGYWSLMIAFRHTDQFAAVSGHSSHLRLETDAARYNPLATYALADLSRMRIWMDWGETDFLRQGQQQLRDSLQAASIPVDAHVNPGGHNDAYWSAHLAQYLAWHAGSWSMDRASYSNCAS